MIVRTLRARCTFVQKSSNALRASVSSRCLQVCHRPLTQTCVRWNSSATKESEPVVAVSEANTSEIDVKIDLSTIGAEKAKVLTVADVLNAREKELALNKTLFDFEEWESIAGTETVHDAVLAMVGRNTGSLIVTEAHEGIVGIITERDILKKISPRTVMTEEKHVRDVMSSHIMCIHPSTTVIDALATMTKENIRHLAVVNGDMASAVKRGSVQEEDMRCVLSITDIVRAYAEYQSTKRKEATAESSTDIEAEVDKKAMVAEGADCAKTEASVPVDAEATRPFTPVVTAAALLKKKHKRIQLILNTRPEDHVTVAAAVEEMAKRDFGAVLVVDKDQRVLGIFTERDYIHKILFEVKDPAQVLVTDVMSPITSVLQLEDSLEKCWDLAATSNCRHFPVIGVMRQDREKELAGILSIKDIVREISKDHDATPGFRLMEFLKSKMELKRTEHKHPATELKSETTETKTASLTNAVSIQEPKEDATRAVSSDTKLKNRAEEPIVTT
ncbi:inosine-5-monophosphate dehydrogenase [Plasmopara halstedii]|uniref:Inosine-5-monophosphate dehydrogenase n=1 Tax=Plasmopara halstedii TaxID=4781 RepID=A0A0P1APS1_PLAHL|nr:inosine-5-monophosphate dehydrogenase [Plasmopara halstedii]CEG43071.1 inosine-5-monophosphate dehydrogenase [Plasmopara halstedii]|eukprot:XP_024579440.1 inosine-5-monophosphate dehydrogenase [Plasmopara halstedii]